MSRLDDLIAELQEQGRDEDVEELEKLSGSTLRKKAAEAEKLERENAELKAQIEKAAKAPAIKKAFEEYGVNLDELSKLERKAIESYDGEVDEEAIAAFVEDNELPLIPNAGNQEGEEPAPAERISAAARNSGRTATATIKPTDLAGMSMDRMLALRDAHPDEWEALKRGETVTGITV